MKPRVRYIIKLATATYLVLQAACAHLPPPESDGSPGWAELLGVGRVWAVP